MILGWLTQERRRAIGPVKRLFGSFSSGKRTGSAETLSYG
jgi:hypothetical protein